MTRAEEWLLVFNYTDYPTFWASNSTTVLQVRANSATLGELTWRAIIYLWERWSVEFKGVPHADPILTNILEFLDDMKEEV